MSVVTVVDIDLTPKLMNLRLYAGDGAQLKITFGQQGAMLDMSKGTFEAQIRASRLDPSPAASWAVDQTDAAQGVVILSLTGEQTAQLMADDPTVFTWIGAWDVQWQPTGSEPLTLFTGDCYCEADVTR